MTFRFFIPQKYEKKCTQTKKLRFYTKELRIFVTSRGPSYEKISREIFLRGVDFLKNLMAAEMHDVSVAFLPKK